VPVDPARLNAVGDLVLTEPGELRALADPVRLTLFDLVRRHGPATTPALAGLSGEEAPLVDESLRVLASHGLVDEARDGRWTTDAKGIYFEIPDEPGAQRAARELSNVMLAQYATLPSDWARDEEPQLGLEWARAAGLFNARVQLTADELRGLQESLEHLLEPLTNRSPADAPAESATVRILAYFLPDARSVP
jgi:DNA-binding transcriptional ArsR family regulator